MEISKKYHNVVLFVQKNVNLTTNKLYIFCLESDAFINIKKDSVLEMILWSVCYTYIVIAFKIKTLYFNASDVIFLDCSH